MRRTRTSRPRPAGRGGEGRGAQPGGALAPAPPPPAPCSFPRPPGAAPRHTPPGSSEGAPGPFCLPGEEAGPQPDAVSPGLPGRGEVRAAAGGRGTKAAKAAAHSRGRLQTERPNREREPCNFRGFKRALVFPECSGRVYTVLFFFFLLKKHAQQSKVCGEID